MILSAENYAKFVDIMKKMVPLVKDLQIIDGKVCQKDSDVNYVILGNLTSLITDPELNSMLFYSIEQKSPMFKMFADTDKDIEITFVEAEKRYKFSDGTSSFSMRVPVENAIEKYDEKNLQLLDYNPDKLVTEFTCDKKFIKRVITGMQVYGTDVADLIYNKETQTASLNFGGKTSTTGSFDIFSALPCNIPFSRTSIKLAVFKNSVGDSVTVRINMASDDVIAKAKSPIVISRILTELGGCPFEYRAKRRVEVY